MSLRTNEQQTGALEVAGYLAAIAIVIGSVVGGWNVNLLIALILLVATYAALRDVRALSRLKIPHEPTASAERTLPPQKPFMRVSSGLTIPQIHANQGTERTLQDAA